MHSTFIRPLLVALALAPLAASAQSVVPGPASPSPLNNSNPALNGQLHPQPDSAPIDRGHDNLRGGDSTKDMLNSTREPSSMPDRIEPRDPNVRPIDPTSPSGASAATTDLNQDNRL